MNYNFFYFLIVYLVILKGCEGSTGSEVGGRNENLTEQQNPYLRAAYEHLNEDTKEATNQYLQRLATLESKFTQVMPQDKTFERIGTMSIVNHGHIQISESSEQKSNKPNRSAVDNNTMSDSLLLSLITSNRLQNLERQSDLVDILVPRDCSEVQSNKSGIYIIQPLRSIEPFIVYCDLETNEGGWTVIQHRFDGTVEFYRSWNDYKFGFGNIEGEHWLGLDKLHYLTNIKLNELYVELEDFDKIKKFASYSSFGIGNENEGYRIRFLGKFDGTAGDSMLNLAGVKFSTFDKDQDVWPNNCASEFIGAWWYTACHQSNLNGKYLKGEVTADNNAKGMCWYTFRGHRYSLKVAKIMIRPKRGN